MSDQILERYQPVGADRTLASYYAVRSTVSLAWVATALIIGSTSTFIAGALLLFYPAWDAVANVVDAEHGGLRNNPTQAFNMAVSALTTVAVGIALTARAPETPGADVARAHQCTVGQVAIAWLLQLSPVMLPIPGTSQRTHLEENLAATDVQLTTEQIDHLTAAST